VWRAASVLVRRMEERLSRRMWLHSSARRLRRAGVTEPQQQQETVHLNLPTTTNKDFFSSPHQDKASLFISLFLGVSCILQHRSVA